MKRAIYRVSALLETVDLEFERVLSDRDNYRAEVAQATPTTEVLNVDTLQQMLDASWPGANKDPDGEDYANLLTDLNAFGITTAGALRQLISKWHDAVIADDAETAAGIRKDPKQSSRARLERLDAGVFFTHAGLTRVALSMESPDRWREQSLKLAATKQKSQP